MSWFSNLIGDVTKGVEEVVPGAKQIDQFLNKAGIGPQELAHPFQSPQGWAGDIEHGFSQATHNPYVRDAAEIAAAVALAEFGGPEIFAALQGGTDAVSAADLAAMSAEGSADLSAAAGATEAANAAAIAADAAVPGAAATAAAAAPAAATAATAADAAVPGAMQEITVNAPRIAAQSGGLDPATLFAAANPAINPLTYTGGAQPGAVPSLKSAMDVQIADPTGGGGAPLMQGYSGYEGAVPGANPSFGPMGSEEGGDLSVGTDQGMQATTDPAKGWWGKMGDVLKTPKGALTAAGLGMNLYGLMNRASLPGAAKTALGAAGPATAQAQAMISAGGMAGPLWQQQKAGIDATINQQLADFSRSIQQNAINSGQGGANSDVVQQQIAQKRTELEAQRQAMYMAAAQQNVTNAVAELTGGNQTLMGVANLQFQEDQAAQLLAQNAGNVVGKLASLWPDTPTPSTPAPATSV